MDTKTCGSYNGANVQRNGNAPFSQKMLFYNII